MIKTKQDLLIPGGEVEQILQEAIRSVEDELKLEDKGWINLSTGTGEVISGDARKANLKLSRLYAIKDPLGRQAIRLWTDYTFGSGIAWDAEDDKVKEALEAFWDAKANQSVLSARGQRRGSDKLLIDGEVFFAIFLGANNESKIRCIDPLEITEIITDPDDKDDARFYRRQWTDTKGSSHESIYRSITNIEGKSVTDMNGNVVTHNDEALIYHLTYNTTSQRGNPLLLPALDWMKEYRRFLASRIAIMLALSTFAWKRKVKGGQAAVDAIKAKTHGKDIPAGSDLIENLGVDSTPIKTETGASAAYQDGRMIKLQIAAAVGIPEQYFGDISIGNLATAKTVELPMMKMFQSYQAIWKGAFKDINEVVLEHSGIPEDKWYVDIDFPAIAPEDLAGIAQSLQAIVTVLPNLGDSRDVKQVALMALGIDDTAEVLDALAKESKSDVNIKLARALREFRALLEAAERKALQ